MIKEKINKTPFLFEDITREIIGAAFEVYKVLGYGFLEKVYENALLIELQLRALKVESQKPIRISYKGDSVGDYIADILVEEKVIVELKAEKEYNAKHEAQLINYLKATGLKVGLLINFGEDKCKPKRLVY
jgi:GxxExxY protein